MDCTKNDFCNSLPEGLRKELCSRCHRRLIKAGSIQLYSDFEQNAIMILDGAIMSSIHVGEDVLGYSAGAPTFFLGVPGRMLATNVTFRQETVMPYGYNGMDYLTDCCIASFEHEVIRDMFYTNNDFARSMAVSMIRIMEDSCEMSAILRAPNVYLAAYHLTRYLSLHKIYLTQQQIADITGHDRASISKAFVRIKENDGKLMSDYLMNKKRIVEMYNPIN